MAGWMKGAGVVAGVIAGGAAGAAILGSGGWNRSTVRAVRSLARGIPQDPSAIFTPDMLEGLPTPVSRYFRFALTPGQPFIRSARLRHTGEIRNGGFDASWNAFESVQHFSAHPPGFVWDATIRMAPLVNARVRDSYILGRAAMLGKLAAMVPVVDQEGTSELAISSLQRWLAEAAWFPTALLPGRGVTWDAIDDSSARATITDSGHTAAIVVHFAESGEIMRVTADRYRDVDGVPTLTPWGAFHRAYLEVEGMKIPTEGEAEWRLPEGHLSVWRGRIEGMEYEFMR